MIHSAAQPQVDTRDGALAYAEAVPSIPPALFRDSDPTWLLVEEGFTLAREHEVESLFAIANGYVGNRGCLAEGSALSAPATFIAGVFEHPQTPGTVPQLITLPDWAGVRIWISDEPLSIERGQVLEHRRVLDLRRGMPWRAWRDRDADGPDTRHVAWPRAALRAQTLATP